MKPIVTFQQLDGMLDNVQISKERRNAAYEIIAAILHIGNSAYFKIKIRN